MRIVENWQGQKHAYFPFIDSNFHENETFVESVWEQAENMSTSLQD